MEIQKSAEINELGIALAKAQGSMMGAVKDSSNPYFKSTYADLSSVWDACRKPLTDNGLSVIQIPFNDGETRLGITSMLVHSSGQWVSSSLSALIVKTDAQATGSLLTYLRRYSLSALVGVAPEDDDAEKTMVRGKEGAQKLPAKPPASPSNITVASDAQLKAIAAILSAMGMKTSESRLDYTNGLLREEKLTTIASSKELTKDTASKLIARLKKELEAINPREEVK